MSKSSGDGMFTEVKRIQLLSSPKNAFSKTEIVVYDSKMVCYDVMIAKINKLFSINVTDISTVVHDLEYDYTRELPPTTLCDNDLIMWVIELSAR